MSLQAEVPTDELWITGPPWWPAHEYVTALDGRDIRRQDNRYAMCRNNPLLFGLLYFPHLMLQRDPRDPAAPERIYLSDLHCDMAKSAVRWARDDIGIGEIRDAWIAPRGAAKSTWLLVILVIWALAFGHLRFIVLLGSTRKAIADTHFKNLVDELTGNELISFDFPNLTSPERKPQTSEYRAGNGTVVIARGLDESNLGLNIKSMRPDGLFIDDPEADEGNFSLTKKDKRIATIRQAVLGMNLRAVVQWAGTTTAYNCLAHDLVRSAVGEDTSEWVAETGFRCHYYPVIITDGGTTQRSLWPVMWPMSYLLEHRGERDFELNLMNRPLTNSGTMWTQDSFVYGIPESWARGFSRYLLRIDPAVTSKATSDYTGMCVAAYSSSARSVGILMANAVRVDPDGLRTNAELALAQFPEIREIQVEGNQGMDYVARVLHGLPKHIKVTLPRSAAGKDASVASKATRFGVAFNYYQRGIVRHAHQFRIVEDQMLGFPNAAFDDGADAVVGAVNELLHHLPKL